MLKTDNIAAKTYSPIFNKTGSSNNKTPYNSKIFFKGSEQEQDTFEKKYTSDEITLAKKYMYVENNFSLIFDEVWKSYSWYNRNFNSNKTQADTLVKFRKISDLIYEYRKQNRAKTERIEKLNNDIKIMDEAMQREEETCQKINEQVQKSIAVLKEIQEMKLEKLLIGDKRKNKIFSVLDDKYIAIDKIAAKDKSNITYPDGIMIIGTQNKDEVESTIAYLKNNGCNITHLNFADFKNPDSAKSEINKIKNNNKLEDKHSILYIENFDKFTVFNRRNLTIIRSLKPFLCRCSKDFNTTILVFENNPEKLDNAITGGHRFQTKINISDIKYVPKNVFIPIKDGYTLRYDAEESAQANLYLGDCSCNDKILWADTDKNEQIKNVADRISEIKQLEKFKNVEYLQVPKPDSFNNLQDFYPLPYRYTQNGIPIYEKFIGDYTQ